MQKASLRRYYPVQVIRVDERSSLSRICTPSVFIFDIIITNFTITILFGIVKYDCVLLQFFCERCNLCEQIGHVLEEGTLGGSEIIGVIDMLHNSVKLPFLKAEGLADFVQLLLCGGHGGCNLLVYGVRTAGSGCDLIKHFIRGINIFHTLVQGVLRGGNTGIQVGGALLDVADADIYRADKTLDLTRKIFDLLGNDRCRASRKT